MNGKPTGPAAPRRWPRRRVLVGAVVLFIAGVLVGAGGLILVDQYVPNLLHPPQTVFSGRMVYNGSGPSLRYVNATLTVPGPLGHVAVLLVEIQGNTTDHIVNWSIDFRVSLYNEVAFLRTPYNGNDSTIVVPTGTYQVAVDVGDGDIFSLVQSRAPGRAYSVSVTIIDEGILATE